MVLICHIEKPVSYSATDAPHSHLYCIGRFPSCYHRNETVSNQYLLVVPIELNSTRAHPATHHHWFLPRCYLKRSLGQRNQFHHIVVFEYSPIPITNHPTVFQLLGFRSHILSSKASTVINNVISNISCHTRQEIWTKWPSTCYSQLLPSTRTSQAWLLRIMNHNAKIPRLFHFCFVFTKLYVHRSFYILRGE